MRNNMMIYSMFFVLCFSCATDSIKHMQSSKHEDNKQEKKDPSLDIAKLSEGSKIYSSSEFTGTNSITAYEQKVNEDDTLHMSNFCDNEALDMTNFHDSLDEQGGQRLEIIKNEIDKFDTQSVFEKENEIYEEMQSTQKGDAEFNQTKTHGLISAKVESAITNIDDLNDDELDKVFELLDRRSFAASDKFIEKSAKLSESRIKQVENAAKEVGIKIESMKETIDVQMDIYDGLRDKALRNFQLKIDMNKQVFDNKMKQLQAKVGMDKQIFDNNIYKMDKIREQKVKRFEAKIKEENLKFASKIEKCKKNLEVQKKKHEDALALIDKKEKDALARIDKKEMDIIKRMQEKGKSENEIQAKKNMIELERKKKIEEYHAKKTKRTQSDMKTENKLKEQERKDKEKHQKAIVEFEQKKVTSQKEIVSLERENQKYKANDHKRKKEMDKLQHNQTLELNEQKNTQDNFDSYMDEYDKKVSIAEAFIKKKLSEGERFRLKASPPRKERSNIIPGKVEWVEVKKDTESRIICLIDATGSMSSLLNKTKSTVHVMFQRAKSILKNSGIKENCFEMQFGFYRNYNSEKHLLFQHSSWEKSPVRLKQYLDPIKVEGGYGNEAIEIGLWHANCEHSKKAISEVILIGDAAPNTKNQVESNRKIKGENYWANSVYSTKTHWDKELNTLRKNDIPVHAFYLEYGAKASFEKIAMYTNATHRKLDIDSSSGKDLLTDIITRRILDSIGGQDLVNAYDREYDVVM